MKTIDEYMAMPYRMELIPDTDEGGYTVRFPDLPGCLSCGETLESAMQNAENAKRTWFEAVLEEGIAVPEPTAENEYSGQFKLRLPKSLHRALAEHSRAEGISMNQYCLYLLTKNDAAYRGTNA